MSVIDCSRRRANELVGAVERKVVKRIGPKNKRTREKSLNFSVGLVKYRV